MKGAGGGSMLRKAMKALVVALATVLVLGTLVEAAPKKVVKHRTRHGSRVSAVTTPSRRPALTKKRTTKKRITRANLAASRPVTVKRRTSTKPR
jgi:hypothetical protein